MFNINSPKIEPEIGVRYITREGGITEPMESLMDKGDFQFTAFVVRPNRERFRMTMDNEGRLSYRRCFPE